MDPFLLHVDAFCRVEEEGPGDGGSGTPRAPPTLHFDRLLRRPASSNPHLARLDTYSHPTSFRNSTLRASVLPTLIPLHRRIIDRLSRLGFVTSLPRSTSPRNVSPPVPRIRIVANPNRFTASDTLDEAGQTRMELIPTGNRRIAEGTIEAAILAYRSQIGRPVTTASDVVDGRGRRAAHLANSARPLGSHG